MLSTATQPMKRNAKIFVAGHCGMVGSAIVRRLEAGAYTNVLTRSRAERDQHAVHSFLTEERAARRVHLVKIAGFQTFDHQE